MLTMACLMFRLLLLLTLHHTVLSLRCLECDHVSKPIHCRTVAECPKGTVCGIEQYRHTNGLLSYNLGCRPQSCPGDVHGNVSKRSITQNCNECCSNDLCNARGCGSSGYPSPRGPVCYSCVNTEFCEDVIGCNEDEECYVLVRYDYGDIVLTNGCRSKYLCREHSGSLIGRRRHVTSRQSNQNHLLCDTCCGTDLCNSGCHPNTIGCGQLPTLSHGHPVYTNVTTSVGSVVNFQCEHGYVLNGTSTTTCLVDGHWDLQTIPKCLAVCNTIVPPNHGNVTYSSSTLISGTIATFTCAKGYGLNGTRASTCNGEKWDYQSTPSCFISCGMLPSISQGSIGYHDNSTLVGSLATYSCAQGYLLNGSAVVSCQQGGSWNLTYQSCLKVTNCNQIQKIKMGGASSGVYTIAVSDGSGVAKEVYCDMDTDGGGWTVIQRRFDGSVNFTRSFVEYENGFGDLHGEHWLGLKWIKKLSDVDTQTLRVDLVDGNNQTAYATYNSFHLGPASLYTLHLGTFSGNSSNRDVNGLSYNNGSSFYTYDRDNSNACAHKDAAGWWYKRCTYANINGVYEVPGRMCSSSYGERCMIWKGFRDYQVLRATSMKLRNI